MGRFRLEAGTWQGGFAHPLWYQYVNIHFFSALIQDEGGVGEISEEAGSDGGKPGNSALPGAQCLQMLSNINIYYLNVLTFTELSVKQSAKGSSVPRFAPVKPPILCRKRRSLGKWRLYSTDQ